MIQFLSDVLDMLLEAAFMAFQFSHGKTIIKAFNFFKLNYTFIVIIW